MLRDIAARLKALVAGVGSLLAGSGSSSRAMTRELEQLRQWQEDLDRRCGC
jgi:hypothetical protein